MGAIADMEEMQRIVGNNPSPIPAMDVLEKWIGPPWHDSFVDILGSPESAR